MEPVDYLKIIRRHWKVAAGLVVVTLLAVFLMSPKQPATVYEATHTLLRDEASGDVDGGGSSADNPSVVSLWAVRGEVPQRVKEVLAYDGAVDDLFADVDATPSVELGTVEVTAEGGSPDEAVLLVNTIADEVIRFIDERDQTRAEEENQDRQAKVALLSQQARELEAQIADVGGPDAPRAAGLVAQRDAVAGQIGVLNAEASGASGTKWTSLQRATSATPESESAVGATRGQRMLLAGIVALLLAFGVAIMLDRSDSRLHTKEQAERQFNLPVLAEVPQLPMRLRHRAAVHGFESDPGMAEAYRGLRTALLLYRDHLPLQLEAAELSGQPRRREAGSHPRQVIVVTSPEAGDGKSTTAANLAMAYAEAGQSALVICWDLWRPMSMRPFDVDEALGVSEFLAAGNASLSRFVQTSSVPGLHVVPAGAVGHQPGGQLDAGLRLLDEARNMADVVIIDTAPILAASVTRELVTMADVVVLACRAGRTTSPAAERCSELLERLGAPTLGVVLVGVPTPLLKSDYYTKSKQVGRSERLRATLARPISNGRNGDEGNENNWSPFETESPSRRTGP